MINIAKSKSLASVKGELGNLYLISIKLDHETPLVVTCLFNLIL